MFTGIIEETGIIEQIRRGQDGIALVIRSKLCGEGLQTGDSLAVNGCCLTAVRSTGKKGARLLHFDLLSQTWNLTSFFQAVPGAAVNLERSLLASGRFHGHIVTGHIDGLAQIRRWEKKGNDWLLDLDVPAALRPHLAAKGSIAVDGISLTIARKTAKGCQIWIIPHTYQVTALKERRQGSLVNVETDILAKYLESLSLPVRRKSRS